MNKSQRIYLSSGDTGNENQDKYIKVKLEQDIDTIEFMSLSLGTADVYQNFNADYGVLVGRVVANGGIGIPNAKISIFIPITDEDAEDPDIYSFYPYKTPRDVNNDGKRYNLLPRVSKINSSTSQLEPKQAFGSFPIKEEIVGNPPFLDTYKKYYKYTALTNDAGDYMIFGVPVGTQTVHLSCDITDIGEYSMNPASMIVNLGYSESQFIDRGTRIKTSDDLGDLPNIETQEITVEIRPFWGDAENYEIGIVRQDFRIRALLTNTFTMFGTTFTDSDQTMRGTEDDEHENQKEIRDLYFAFPQDKAHAFSLSTKRIGSIKETIYYYPSNMSDSEIDTADPISDMLILDPSEYSTYYRNGDFVFIVNCNRDRVITNESGVKIPVDYDNPNGVFTTFRGFVTLEYETDELPMVGTSGLEESIDGNVKEKDRTLPLRTKFKFPQHATVGGSFDYTNDSKATSWRKQHMKFEAQKFYSFSKFNPCTANNVSNDNENFPLDPGPFFDNEDRNDATKSGEYNIGVIHVGDYGEYDNSQYGMISNSINAYGNTPTFGANWLNLAIYFPQTGYALNDRSQIKSVRTASFLHPQWEDESVRNPFFVFDNSMPIAAGQINTKWYGRSDLHWTDIIEVPLDDIIMFNEVTGKGFKDSNVVGYTIQGKYRNGSYTPPTTDWKGIWGTSCPYNGGKMGGNPAGSVDNRFYFFKGFDTADCIEFLYDLGIIT